MARESPKAAGSRWERVVTEGGSPGPWELFRSSGSASGPGDAGCRASPVEPGKGQPSSVLPSGVRCATGRSGRGIWGCKGNPFPGCRQRVRAPLVWSTTAPPPPRPLAAQPRELRLSRDGEVESPGCTRRERADRHNKGERGPPESSAAAGEPGSGSVSLRAGRRARGTSPDPQLAACPTEAAEGSWRRRSGGSQVTLATPSPERRPVPGGSRLPAPAWPPILLCPAAWEGSCLGGSGGWRGPGLARGWREGRQARAPRLLQVQVAPGARPTFLRPGWRQGCRASRGQLLTFVKMSKLEIVVLKGPLHPHSLVTPNNFGNEFGGNI